jgi:hypothetical protein
MKPEREREGGEEKRKFDPTKQCPGKTKKKKNRVKRKTKKEQNTTVQ